MIAVVAMAAAAAAQPAPTVQEMFNAATTAADNRDWAGALAAYQAIEARLAGAGKSRNMAIVRVRKGNALFSLGRFDEAEAALRLGLTDLPEADDTLRADRLEAMLNLAAIAEAGLDFAAAQRGYADAGRAAPDDVTRLAALAGLVRTRMFDDPAAAVADAGRGLAMAAAMPGALTAGSGQWRTLKGRALLNKGDFAAAKAELTIAMKELGGLTLRVDAADIAARSDLAIAAMLAGDKDKAREYLAYTGAGRLKGDGFAIGADMTLPPCGGEDGLRPNDVAVIEFSIGDDGAVNSVSPIYASRNGSVALAFARAVREWSWSPHRVKTIDPFLRLMTRLELRCSTASSRPSVLTILRDASLAWMRAHGIAYYVAPDVALAAQVAAARAELARREAASGPQSAQLTPVLGALAFNPTLPADESLALIERADAILRANGAPAAFLAQIAIGKAGLKSRELKMPDRLTRANRYAELLRAAMADPAIIPDVIASAALRVAIADALADARRSIDGLPFLQAVAADVRLDQRDPLRIAALIRIASIKAATGDLADARAAFEQTGLSAAQCALVDATPALVRSNASSNSFPMDAMLWGFEGWARTEFDVAADGRTVGVRAVISYPPFIFGPAAQHIMSGARYTQSYRPDGGLGCGGQAQMVRFGLPH